jgi:glycine cleavage system aminomethyltransferase T
MIGERGLLDGPSRVPPHYGSPVGELAACVRGAGLVDRSDLQVLEIAGQAPAVAEVVEHATGSSLEPGGCALADGTWWCARAPGRVLALNEPGSRPPLDTARLPPGHDVQVTDRCGEIAAIGVVGRAALELLAAVGAVDDARLAPCFGTATVAGAGVELVIQSDRRAVLLAPRGAARHVWGAVEAAGGPFGLCYVGAEALARFTLLERMLEATSPPPTA